MNSNFSINPNNPVNIPVQENVSHIAVKDIPQEQPVRVAEKPQNGEGDKEPIDQKTLQGYVDKANKLAAIFDKSIKFVTNYLEGRSYVQVIDNQTHEVIKEIPPKYIKSFISSVESAIGMVVDKKA